MFRAFFFFLTTLGDQHELSSDSFLYIHTVEGWRRKNISPLLESQKIYQPGGTGTIGPDQLTQSLSYQVFFCIGLLYGDSF